MNPNITITKKPSAPILSCPTHVHPQWELIYQLDAPTTAVTALGNHRVEPGELIIIPPNVPHRTVSDTPFRDYCVKLEHFDAPKTPTVVRDIDGTILALYNVIAGVQDERGDEAATLLLEKLSEALVLAVRRATTSLSKPQAVETFRRILRENIENPYFDITESIRSLGYHPDYFRRLFKHHVTVSPLRYLNGMRMERAKDLLRLESSLSVGEIALRCGFRDPLYFSTAFRNETGVSPMEYRKGAAGEKGRTRYACYP